MTERPRGMVLPSFRKLDSTSGTLRPPPRNTASRIFPSKAMRAIAGVEDEKPMFGDDGLQVRQGDGGLGQVARRRNGRGFVGHQGPLQRWVEGIADIQGVVAPATLPEADDGDAAFGLGDIRIVVQPAVAAPARGRGQIQQVDGRRAIHHELVGIGPGGGSVDVVQILQEVRGHETPELVHGAGDDRSDPCPRNP